MKVLIVDDLDTNRKLLRINLEAQGIEAVEAADGVEALAALNDGGANAIISDILMPRMDGYRLCQEVRRSEVFGQVPFIFYTSTYTSPGDEKLAMACGADRYLKKPSAINDILSALRESSDARVASQRAAAAPVETVVMREYNEALVRKLEERNDQLEAARAQIALANERLERRVEERTAELRLANEELEAFGQSIAHDLRSPLTVIDGFSYLIVEDCRGKVSQQVMDRLSFIGDASRRMNEITNDLLRLASANRAEMSRRPVDLSELAAAIVNDLRSAHPERPFAYTGAPSAIVNGDVGLLRIALENLLGNAWKYSGKTAESRIEFGVRLQDGETQYYVRDNGAGFDLAKAGKLFSTFGRLHSVAEFPGTGIGLSTVHRIVTRHGGRIWADAALGRGATFFFTLPPSTRAATL
jgi:signal transduction histidine kinase